MPPSSAGSALGFTSGANMGSSGIPANKENNNTKKTTHESLSISTAAGTQLGSSNSNINNLGATHGQSQMMSNGPGSSSHSAFGPAGGLSKMSLKGREFGKEITNNSHHPTTGSAGGVNGHHSLYSQYVP
jgi:hypothetical protein